MPGNNRNADILKHIVNYCNQIESFREWRI